MARNSGSGSMTVEEAGRKGGETTKRRHGDDFYERIGRKGGEARAQNRAREAEQNNEE